MINRSNIEILYKLVEALNDAVNRLEETQKKGKQEEAEKIKESILDTQKRIGEILK